MSFKEQEQSTESAAPIELYKITGSESFFYTSSSVEYTYAGDVYKPIPITRTAPTVNDKETSGSLTIKFPFNNEFVTRYLRGVPPSPDLIQIYRLHLSDTAQEVFPFIAGSVSGVKFKEQEATVTISALPAKTSGQIPTKTFSWMCNHVLYDSSCKVSATDFTFDFSISSVSSDGVSLTLTDSGLAAAEIATDVAFFNGGTLTTGVSGDQRMLIRLTQPDANINSYQVDLMVPIDDVSVGQAVSVSAGCDHSVHKCHTRFANTENYGGFTFIPTLNLFAIDNRLRSTEG